MTVKKQTKAPSKTASASSKRLQNSTKPSEEQKPELTASTVETENQNQSTSNSNQSSQTETSKPQTISSSDSTDGDVVDPELEDLIVPEDEDLQDDDDDQSDDDTTTDLDDSDDDEDQDDPEEDKSYASGGYRPAGAPQGRIIREGEDVVFDAERHETYAVITEDVYQEIHLRGSKRVSYRLVYSAGTAIPLKALEEK